MNDLPLEFQKYRDCFGLNQLSTTNGVADVSQNGTLFTMEYLICLLEDPTISSAVKEFEIQRLKEVYWSCEAGRGLLTRYPGCTEYDSMDNHGAALVFSAFFDTGIFAHMLRERGRTQDCTGPDEEVDAEQNKKYFRLASLLSFSWSKPKYYWNCARPDKFCTFSWWGWNPGFMGLIDLTSRGWTTPLRWIGLMVGQFLGCNKEPGDTDARKLPYINWYFLTRKTGPLQRWAWKLAYKLWVRILMKQYPNGMRDVYSIYYRDPDHPIRKYSQPYFKS